MSTPVEPPKATVKTEPTDASPQRIGVAFFERMNSDLKKSEAPAKVEEKKVDPAPAPKAEKKVEPKEEKTEGFDPAAPLPPRAAKMDTDDIRTLVRETVDGVVRATKKETPAPVEAKSEFSRSIQNLMPALEELEKQPEYKGLKAQAEAFYKKGGLDDQYRDRWSKANPGKKFSRDDEEHDEFYAENDPKSKIDEDDLEAAREQVITRKVEERVSTKIDRKQAEREVQESRSKVEPLVKSDLNRIAMDALAGLSPEFKELVKTPEKLSTLDQDDPIAEHVLIQVVGKHQLGIAGVREIFTGAVPFDPKNPAHARADEVTMELQEAILQVPDNTRVINGRKLKFATIEQIGSMTPAERSRHWHVDLPDLLTYIGSRVKSESSVLYKKLKGSQVVAKNGRPAEAAKANGTADTTASEGSPTAGSHSPAPVAKSEADQSVSGFRSVFARSMGVK